MSKCVQQKPDNSFLDDKINLRMSALDAIDKQNINVLDLFHGYGKIWEFIKKASTKNIDIMPVDIKKNLPGFYVCVDNLRFLKAENIERYDIIDIDAYGLPFELIEIIFRKKYRGCVIVTMISSVLRSVPKSMIESIGFNYDEVKPAKAIFSPLIFDIMSDLLYRNNVKKIKLVNHENNNGSQIWYFSFVIE